MYSERERRERELNSHGCFHDVQAACPPGGPLVFEDAAASLSSPVLVVLPLSPMGHAVWSGGTYNGMGRGALPDADNEGPLYHAPSHLGSTQWGWPPAQLSGGG